MNTEGHALDFTRSFDAELAAELDTALAATPQNLARAIRYSALGPGKRIRPRLLLASAQMLAAPRVAALPAAVALELIHCFTLIHDDLPCMDNDDFRRGLPTCHKAHGEALALLAGDALIPAAFEIFARAAEAVPASAFLAGFRRLARASGPAGVIGGQAAELGLPPSPPIAQVRQMHRAKTGALFDAAILIPADFTGLDARSAAAEALGSFAREFGQAFQAADDLDDAAQDAGAAKNLLAFMPAQELARSAEAGLQAACEALDREWKRSAAPLIALAQGLLDKLKR